MQRRSAFLHSRNLTTYMLAHYMTRADYNLMHIAAKHGCLEGMMVLRATEPPCPWHENICSAAAGGGHLHVLQWLRSQDPPCPWNAGTCLYAAEGGHLHVLQWARSQDPPCPE